MPEYSLDAAWEREKERLDALSAIYEDGTRRHITALGIAEGWRCAEIGGGTGSVAAWLCQQVGPSGRVVATDLDTRFLDALDAPNLEVRRHDIVEETLETATYDVIHARLLLMHLGDGRGRALAHIIDALKPGGWLIAEEFDDVSNGGMRHPPDDKVDKVAAAINALFQRLGVDPFYGRKLPADLQAAGLRDIRTEARTAMIESGTPQIKGFTLLLDFIRDRFIEANLLTGDEVDYAIAAVGDCGGTWSAPPLMVAAWGRRPVA